MAFSLFNNIGLLCPRRYVIDYIQGVALYPLRCYTSDGISLSEVGLTHFFVSIDYAVFAKEVRAR